MALFTPATGLDDPILTLNADLENGWLVIVTKASRRTFNGWGEHGYLLCRY
ncbi:MAG: hypothetical protein M3R24_12695 [Chloroflexota bacterium]|nr:hypothetical protein [Chloroflexota bacterium]